MVVVTESETDEAHIETADIISLSIPASHEFVRLARIGAASIARRRGLSVRAIDDLRLAIDESFRILIGDPPIDGDDLPQASALYGKVDVTFEVDDHELSVLLAGHFDGDELVTDPEQLGHFEAVLADLVDRFEADATSKVVQFSKRLS